MKLDEMRAVAVSLHKDGAMHVELKSGDTSLRADWPHRVVEESAPPRELSEDELKKQLEERFYGHA